MRLVFLLVVTTLFSCRVLAQTERLLQNLEKLRTGFIISAISDIEIEANRGDVWSQLVLGVCYENGYGVTLNNNTAFKLYRKTAESGLAIGQYCVARCYREGIGISRNLDKAEYWAEKASDKFNTELLTLINTYYQEGLQNPHNYSLNPDANINSLSANNFIGNNVNSNNTFNIIITSNYRITQALKLF